jgi:hypothetical protein
MLSMTDSTDVTWSYNIMEDIEGTAFIAGLNNGTAANWKIYGNVGVHTAAYAANTGRGSTHNFGVAGIVYIANDASNNNSANNWLIYNNTFYNIKGTYSGIVIQAGSGNTVQNNIWYNSVRTNNSGSTAYSYNWYFNTNKDSDTAASSVTCSSQCNLFVDGAGKNFRLGVATVAGAALSAAYNMDMDGKVRGTDGTWDRGAYEFSNTPSISPAPPTNLITQVQ